MGKVVVIGNHFQCRHHSHYLLPVEQEEDSESDDDTDQLVHQTCFRYCLVTWAGSCVIQPH